MAIHYPDGNTFHTNQTDRQTPRTVHSGSPRNTLYGNRGMRLEDDINHSNAYYLATNQAVIHKKPTPIQIVKVDYPKRSAAVIKEAYFRQMSTTDYNGVYNGYYLDFEAKETKNKRSFPLNNFHEHQIIHMEKCLDQRGIIFVLIRFTHYDKVFLFPARYLIPIWKKAAHEGRKSIPLSFIEKHSYEISYGVQPRLHYLQAVDKMLAESAIEE